MRLKVPEMKENLFKSSAASNQDAIIEAALKAPYRRELVPNEDGTWFARVAELNGCMTEGATREEALTNLDDAMRAWLSVQLEDGEQIPQPIANVPYSGKLLLRIAQQLHRQVAECAERSGVSINAYISTAVAKAVGEEYGAAPYRLPGLDSFGACSLIAAYAGSVRGVRSVLFAPLEETIDEGSWRTAGVGPQSVAITGGYADLSVLTNAR